MKESPYLNNLYANIDRYYAENKKRPDFILMAEKDYKSCFLPNLTQAGMNQLSFDSAVVKEFEGVKIVTTFDFTKGYVLCECTGQVQSEVTNIYCKPKNL